MKKVDFSKELKIFKWEQVELNYSNRLSWQKQKCSGEINIGKSSTDYFWEWTAHGRLYLCSETLGFLFVLHKIGIQYSKNSPIS